METPSAVALAEGLGHSNALERERAALRLDKALEDPGDAPDVHLGLAARHLCRHSNNALIHACAAPAMRKVLAQGRPPRSLSLTAQRLRVTQSSVWSWRARRAHWPLQTSGRSGWAALQLPRCAFLPDASPPLAAPGRRVAWHPAASLPPQQRANVINHRPALSAAADARPGRRHWCRAATAPPLPTRRRSCACGCWRTGSRACAWRSAGAWARSRRAAGWPPGRPCGARCWAASSAAGCAPGLPAAGLSAALPQHVHQRALPRTFSASCCSTADSVGVALVSWHALGCVWQYCQKRRACQLTLHAVPLAGPGRGAGACIDGRPQPGCGPCGCAARRHQPAGAW